MARTHYPTGQATFGGSTIVAADNHKIDITNATSLKATLANKNGLPVDGMRSVTITFDMYLDNEQAAGGVSLPVVTAVLNGTAGEPLELGYKNGNVSVLASCVVSQISIVAKLGEPDTYSVTAMGSVIDNQGC